MSKPEPAPEATRPKRKWGRVFGIAAVLVLLVAGGAVLLLSGRDSADDTAEALEESGSVQEQTTGPGVGEQGASTDTSQTDTASAGTSTTEASSAQAVVPEAGGSSGLTAEAPPATGAETNEADELPPEMAALLSPGEVDDDSVDAEDQHDTGSRFSLTSQTRSQAADTDIDGMSDWLEDELVERFKPVLAFDEEERKCADPWSSWAAIYQVTPSAEAPWLAGAGFTPVVVKAPDASEPLDSFQYAVITFVTAYQVDCGDPVFGGWDHPGDTEAVYIVVSRPAGGVAAWDNATIDALYVKRHYDPIKAYSASDVAKWYGEHPVLWVSEAKHAQYVSAGECEWYPLHLSEDQLGHGAWQWVVSHTVSLVGHVVYLEDCGGGPEILPTTTWMQNVGEIDYPGWDRQAIDRLGDSESPLLSGMYPYEEAWLDTRVDADGETHEVKFCGGGSADECGGNLRGKWIISDVVPRVANADDDIVPDIDARVENMWVAYEATSDFGLGIELQIFLRIDNQGAALGLPVEVEVLNSDGTAVYTSGLATFHEAGALGATGVANATAGQTTTYLQPFTMYIPYNQFYPGESDYRFRVTVYSADGSEEYDRYETESLPVAFAGALSGGWISESGIVYGVDPGSHPSEYLWDIRNAVDAAEYGTITVDRYRVLAQIWGPDGTYWGQRGGTITRVYVDSNLPAEITWDDGGTWSK